MANKVQTLVIPFFKVDIEILNDSKVKMLRKMPAGDTLFVLWIGLLSLAMKADDPGTVELGRGIPFSPDMLSAELDIDISVVRMGLETFARLRMIEILPGDTIFVSNFEKHQALDKIRSNREATRKRVAAHRERKHLLLNSKGNSYNEDCNANVTNHVTNKEENCNGTEKNLIDINRIDINREFTTREKSESLSSFPKSSKPKFASFKSPTPSDFEHRGLDLQITDTIDYWNSKSNLPRYRYNVMTMPDAGEMRHQFDAFGEDEIKKAIDNLDKYYPLESPKYRPSAFNRFVLKSLERWTDDANPGERYEDEEQQQPKTKLSQEQLNEIFK